MIKLADLNRILDSLGRPDWADHVHEGSYKNLKQLAERIAAIEGIEGAEDTPLPKKLRTALTRQIERLVYGVTESYVYMWDREDGRRKNSYAIRRFDRWIGRKHDGSFTNVRPSPEKWREELAEDEVIYRRPYFMQRTLHNKSTRKEEITGDPVWHIEFTATRSRRQNKRMLRQLKKEMSNHGWTFIGCKAKGSQPIAVFGKGENITEALVNICGDKIAREILRGNNMKQIQNLVIMLCRVGWKARFTCEEGDSWIVDDFEPVVRKGIEWDGVMFGLDKPTSEFVRQLFMMPEDTKLCAGSYLGAAWTKGLILLDQPVNFVCQESVKLGDWTHELDCNKLMIHEMDSLALSKTKKEREIVSSTDDDTQELNRDGKKYFAGMNLGQEWVYCFNPTEQELLANKVFIPEIERAGSLTNRFHALKNVDRLIAKGVLVDDIDLGKIQERIRTWTLQTALNAPIPGMYVIFAPDPKLKSHQIRVPLKSQKNGIYPGDKVCVTRHPCLAVGNATQVYEVMGYTEGNFAQVATDPWMTVQGGDFDGDLGRISKWLHDLLPNKKWDRTLMSDIVSPTNVRKGVRSTEARLEQAVTVLDQKIGLYDFAGRQAWELGHLDYGVRLMLSQQVQANIHLAKHIVAITDITQELREICPKRINGKEVQYATGIVKRAVKTPKSKLLKVTENLPYHKLFVRAYELVDQELPKQKLDKGRLKSKADTIPEEEELFSRKEWLALRTEGRRTAQIANKQFFALWQTGQQDIEYMILADNLSIHLEKESAGAADMPIPERLDMLKDHARLLKLRKRAARDYLLLQLGAMCKWRLICRLSIPGWEKLAEEAVG